MAEEKEGNENILERYGHVAVYKEGAKTIYFLDIDVKSVNLSTALEMILHDDNIEEIMFNGEKQPIRVFHHKHGMCDTNLMFPDTDAMAVISDIADYNKKSISDQNPILDGVLRDGSRVNVVVPPASLDITITIRKFRHAMITVIDMVKDNIFSSESAAFIWTCISRTGNPANILFIGGTASGKTTALNAFSMFIGQRERIVLIEDTPELQLKQPNIVRMLSNKERKIDMDSLLKNALRMRPDRIIVGEVRGPEAVTLFTAMNTGHDGTLGTLHANSSKECIARITDPPMNVPMNMLRALNLIVVLKKVPSGERFVEEISEVAGVDQNVRLNKLYAWDPAKKQCIDTGIPSRLKADIAAEAGKSMADINKMIAARAKMLDDLIEKKAGMKELLEAANMPIEELIEKIDIENG